MIAWLSVIRFCMGFVWVLYGFCMGFVWILMVFYDFCPLFRPFHCTSNLKLNKHIGAYPVGGHDRLTWQKWEFFPRGGQKWGRLPEVLANLSGDFILEMAIFSLFPGYPLGNPKKGVKSVKNDQKNAKFSGTCTGISSSFEWKTAKKRAQNDPKK